MSDAVERNERFATDILLKMLDKGYLEPNSNDKNALDTVLNAYKAIFKTIDNPYQNQE